MEKNLCKEINICRNNKTEKNYIEEYYLEKNHLKSNYIYRETRL